MCGKQRIEPMFLIFILSVPLLPVAPIKVVVLRLHRAGTPLTLGVRQYKTYSRGVCKEGHALS